MWNGFEGPTPRRSEGLNCGIVELFYLSIWLVVDPARASGRDRIWLI